VDRVRVGVVETGADVAGVTGAVHVELWVNDVEMTAAGAGLGMDAVDVLVPVHRLVATERPRRVAVARCGCGVYGCGSTDVVVQRVGDTVRWDWEIEVPLDRPAVFDAAEYDREMARVEADRSWETPAHTAGRRVLERADRGRLREHGLELTDAVPDWRNPRIFTAWMVVPERYQVVLDVPWEGRTPEALADEVCRILALSPTAWTARWMGNTPDTRDVLPAIAGAGWRPL
jgi:hypothetical protein